MATDTQPRETSPLVPKPIGNDIQPTHPTYGVAPEDDPPEESDLERQTSNGDSSKHQGLPEVRKRMKYIFPALAIGVSTTLPQLHHTDPH
jgi:hypothetical protein